MAKVEKSGKYFIVYGYDRFLNRFRLNKKRALLNYLPQAVMESLQDKKIVRFSNSGIVLAWARVLNELGYIVDVIDWEDVGYKPTRKYDLVVLHGGKNSKAILDKLADRPRVIYFSSGSYWKFSNQAEDKRIADFKRRHGATVARDRYIYDSEDPVNHAADGIIALGDPSMAQTYPAEMKVVTINNASYPDDHFEKITKDYRQAKNNFLFFAGSGNIHKGLDLLIDAFKNLEHHLYIVTIPDPEVLKVFKKELSLPNIHLVGQVNMRDPQFYEVMDKCAYVILPSCSEGQAGSVVEAMNQGLIPIVSKETRLDARKYGVVLDDNSIASIKRTVKKMASLSNGEVERLAKLTRKTAVKEHSPSYFRKSLKHAIKTILKKASRD